MSQSLRSASGWLMLGCLVLAPLDYGSTGSYASNGWGAEKLLAALFLGTFGLWLLSCSLVRSRMEPGWADVALLYLLLSGWWMVLNAHSVYQPHGRTFIPLATPVPFAPGSVDQPASWKGMVRMTGLLAAFMVIRSLGRDASWRRRILMVMAQTGLLVAILGVILKLGGPPLMQRFWEPIDIWETNFALFHYHANAGAFLNLTLPVALAFLAQALARSWRSWQSRVWGVTSLVIFVAIQVNLSKAALVIAVLLVLAFSAEWIRSLPAGDRKAGLAAMASFLTISLVATLTLTHFTWYDSSWKKWQLLPEPQHEKSSIDSRLSVEHIALRMARDAGWRGFGPQTFEMVYEVYERTEVGGHPLERFHAAHEDYLQTVIEWGIGGTVAWSLLGFGGLGRAFRRWLSHCREERWVWCAIGLALLGVFIHAGFDYPLQVDSIRAYVLALLALAWGNEGTSGGELTQTRFNPKI